MIQLLKRENWSDAFLLPLTGIKKDSEWGLRSHLFWNGYSINDYKLIMSFTYENYDDFQQYCRRNVCPILDRRGYLLENYDIGNRSIFILDMSEWAKDIEMFLTGKYSKFSKEAKNLIERYHLFNKDKVPAHIYAALHPNMKMELLGGKSPIEYIADEYELNIDDLKKIGEIGSLYKESSETLSTD